MIIRARVIVAHKASGNILFKNCISEADIASSGLAFTRFGREYKEK